MSLRRGGGQGVTNDHNPPHEHDYAHGKTGSYLYEQKQLK
jgi:hypothetical protein